MKKTFTFLLSAFLVLTPYVLFAGSGSNGGAIENPLKGNPDLATLAKNILHILFLAGTVVAVFFIVFAGFKYVTAGGDEGAIKKAHAMLLWAAVGTAILLGAQVIVDVVTNTVQQLSTSK